MYTYTYIYRHEHACVYIRIRIYIYIHKYIYTCMFCTNFHVYIYIHCNTPQRTATQPPTQGREVFFPPKSSFSRQGVFMIKKCPLSAYLITVQDENDSSSKLLS